MKPKPEIMLTPGPVTVPPFIIEAIAQPVIHHRSTEFRHFFAGLQADLQFLFKTENPVIPLPGSGTMAMEMAMRSFFQPGDQVGILAMGKFSDRWLTYGQEMGLEIVPVRLPWGESLELEVLEGLLAARPNLKGLVLTHCETSTGVQIDLEEIAFVAKDKCPGMLLLVDAMSTVGVLPLYTQDWQLDVVVCSSQKGLFNLSGVAFAALSPLAISMLGIPESDDAMHLGHYWKYLAQGSFPFTPPTQLFYGIRKAVEIIREQRLAHRWNESHRLSKLFKKAVQDLGGSLFGLANCDVVTAFSIGKGDQDEIRLKLKEKGLVLAGGQGQLKGKIMRVGHFGWEAEVGILLVELKTIVDGK